MLMLLITFQQLLCFAANTIAKCPFEQVILHIFLKRHFSDNVGRMLHWELHSFEWDVCRGVVGISNVRCSFAKTNVRDEICIWDNA